MVPEMGLEPIWISPFDFKSNAYTNSAIRASLRSARRVPRGERAFLWRRRFAVRQSRPPNMAKKACFHSSWRRRPELNRCTRFCRPLRNHSATAPNEQKATKLALASFANAGDEGFSLQRQIYRRRSRHGVILS